MEMWFSEFHTPDVKHSLRVDRHLFSKQSDFQRYFRNAGIRAGPDPGRERDADGAG